MPLSRQSVVCVLLSAALLLGSCTRRSDASAKSPDAIARAFVEAVHAGQKERSLSLLTEAAREGLESGAGFRLEDGKFTDVEFGRATIDGAGAAVPLTVKEGGNVQGFSLLLKKSDDVWRIFGVHVSGREGGEVTIDFETLASRMKTLSETMAAEFQTAFEEAARQRAAQETAERRERFEALRPLSAAGLESRWKNERDFRGTPAGEAIAALAKELELGLHAAGQEKSLAVDVDVDVRGVSRLEAIEKITRQLGLHPRYPSAQELMARPHDGFGKAFREALAGASRLETTPAEEKPGEVAANAITLSAGPRPLPVCFAGPYLIEVTELEERVPHGTGSIAVTARSFGYDPGVFVMMEDHGETVSFGEVVDREGRSLRARDDVRYYGSGLLVGSAYENSTDFELRGLLREVETIHRLSGVKRLVLPVAVEELEWRDLEEGARRSIGDLSLEVRQTGLYTAFDIRAPEATISDLNVSFRARGASGEELEIVSENSAMWRPDTAQASIQTASPTASVSMKLVTRREVLEYPFEFRDIPLSRHADQPETIEPLIFAGFPAPVEVEFIRFEDPEADFPRILVRTRNQSNKDALSIQATLYYLGDGGETLKDFPQMLTGKYDARGHYPVVARRAEAEVEVTAFFMPKETKGLRVAIERVDFVDGTTWEPEE